jgi:hypothetical protein
MAVLPAVASLVVGPALIALAIATLPGIWHGNMPDYHVTGYGHRLALVSFNLAATSFPFMFASVLALAVAARSTRRLAVAGLGCSMLGLSAMLANAMVTVPLALMNGIAGHDGPATPASGPGSPPLVPLYLFPLYLAGAILAAFALWRSRAVPPITALAISAGGLLPPAIVTGISALALPIVSLRIAGSIPLLLAGRA